ncbi:hypothetical protein CAPTEDRAFT_196841 [Capitella teleta]|uniref:G-protein coupled receptors family 1 profile domain-containing protein n=1 Tax=Capitella teleta TaxID=283909 RepID=R7VGE2_CAPTE|nr:hypothetical protein CAPTEDRAFT_196841 [Capitella teleta]|eukprot:ELU17918.1 hypothetical protein CAPTEDRAFT_196841 [Capitella teleta]
MSACQASDNIDTGLNQQRLGSQHSTMNMDNECRLFDFLICVIAIGTVCVFGLVGNCTSFLVLVKHKVETAAVYLLQCIAVSDSILLLATLLVYTFPSVYAYLGHMERIVKACDIIKLLIWPICMMSHTMTIYLTVLVTFNRYCAICRAVQDYRTQSKKAVWKSILLTFIFSVIYNFPRFFEHQPISQTSANASLLNQSSTMNLGDSVTYQIIYSNVIYYPVMYIFPLTCLSYLNYQLIRSLKAISQKKAILTSPNSRSRRDNEHITLCVVVIVCVFIACQTPALINQIFWAALPANRRECGHFHFYYTKISDLLIVINSSCNIVIYCLCGRRFRSIFLQTLCYWKAFSRKIPVEPQPLDVAMRPLEFQANIQEATDNNEDATMIPIEDRTFEQALGTWRVISGITDLSDIPPDINVPSIQRLRQ